MRSNKSYQYKIYNKDGTLAQTIDGSKIMRDFAFSATVNSGVSDVYVQVNEDPATTTLAVSQFIKIFCYTEDNKSGVNLFTGYISQVRKVYKQTSAYVEISCISLYGLLNRLLYESSSHNVNENDTPGNIIAKVVTYANTQLSYSRFSEGTIDKTGSNVNLDLDHQTCLQVIQKSQEATDKYFFVDASGVVTFQDFQSISGAFTIGKDVQELIIEEDIEDMTNHLHLARSGGSDNEYEDTISQTSYGLFEKYIQRSEIKNSSTQDDRGNNYISENKDPKTVVSAVINNKYNIESIKPGQTYNILNGDIVLQNQQVYRIQYTPDQVRIQFGKYISLPQLIASP